MPTDTAWTLDCLPIGPGGGPCGQAASSGDRVAATIEFGPEPPSRPPETPALLPKPPVALRYGHLPNGLPQWFVDLDTDRDGQIALHEWRKAGLPIEEFMAMDLNGDGLLPPDEYLRFLWLVQSAGRFVDHDDPLAAFLIPGP